MVQYTKVTLNQISFKEKEFRLLLLVVKNMREILSMVYTMAKEFLRFMIKAYIKEIL